MVGHQELYALSSLPETESSTRKCEKLGLNQRALLNALHQCFQEGSNAYGLYNPQDALICNNFSSIT